MLVQNEVWQNGIIFKSKCYASPASLSGFLLSKWVGVCISAVSFIPENLKNWINTHNKPLLLRALTAECECS